MSPLYSFLPDGVSFSSTIATKYRLLYAPLCGPHGDNIKSAITPLLSGDIKQGKSHYLTKPTSREDLRNPLRNFFIKTNQQMVSLADPADEHTEIQIGQLWHQLRRTFTSMGCECLATTFIPSTGENIELTHIVVKNISSKEISFTPYMMVPVFARSLSNKHDHEHVTALLNRIEQVKEGVIVEPSMIFNEEGHRPCHDIYYVFGVDSRWGAIEGSLPTIESFVGESGTLEKPDAVIGHKKSRILSEIERQGKEACGGLIFKDVVLKPQESISYIIGIGIQQSFEGALKEFDRFSTVEKFEKALMANKKFWEEKTSSILFYDGDSAFASWMRWVTLQPILRRIFGCSFLPDHDYGKGGKGWRDIWQDLLSLILIEPESVRLQLLNNFAGIRMDGSNATIIGQKQGEFIADRNAITRVWMDHGAWPLLTTVLYIDQTGDENFWFEEIPYFIDLQASRTTQKNMTWNTAYGNQVKNKKGQIYQGTVLEHLLVENLVQFFNVGEHNIIRLESADWNDGMDMGFARGESVAFMSFYAGNLALLADRLEFLWKKQKIEKISVFSELKILLDTLHSPVNYDHAIEKRTLLFEQYFKAVQPEISGDRCEILIKDILHDLRKKSTWMKEHIRKQEKISVSINQEKYSWFNGYYDNDGMRVEGNHQGVVRMTLTGQVFALMHEVATKQDTKEVIKAVRAFLQDDETKAVRLNSDFGVRHYLSLGRAFGFAYGTKENGAVFSHMAVMYAYALYKQEFAREGYEVLRSLYRLGMNMERANIYPGVPEYFDGQGRGMYHFLTGSASWYVLTLLTMVYGVRGEHGDLVLAPQLVKEEFSNQHEAKVVCHFAGKKIEVVYFNPKKLDVGQYRIKQIQLNDQWMDYADGKKAVVLSRLQLMTMPKDIFIKVLLDV